MNKKRHLTFAEAMDLWRDDIKDIKSGTYVAPAPHPDSVRAAEYVPDQRYVRQKSPTLDERFGESPKKGVADQSKNG